VPQQYRLLHLILLDIYIKKLAEVVIQHNLIF